MNHHKSDISSDNMKLVIYWVEDRYVDVSHLLDKFYIFPLKKLKKRRLSSVSEAHCRKLLIYIDLVTKQALLKPTLGY
jgi:hypothetical protein